MGRKDLGTCIIISKEDVNNLGIKLRNLQKIDDFRTPSRIISPLFIGGKRLIRYVERKAKKEEADLAIITRQTHEFTPSQEYVSCEYSLYKYK